MGLSQGTYSIRDGRGFVLPQAIHAIKQGNYELMLLTETKIPGVVYYFINLGCNVFFSKETVTAAGGAQGGSEFYRKNGQRG